MPRLTNQEYLHRHRFLQQAWVEYEPFFGRLSPTQQWEIHLFYQTKLTMLDGELILRRKLISKTDPSLPNRASKAYLRLAREIEDTTQQKRLYTRLSRISGVTVDATVRPEPDWDMLGQALLNVVEQEQKSEQERAA